MSCELHCLYYEAYEWDQVIFRQKSPLSNCIWPSIHFWQTHFLARHRQSLIFNESWRRGAAGAATAASSATPASRVTRRVEMSLTLCKWAAAARSSNPLHFTHYCPISQRRRASSAAEKALFFGFFFFTHRKRTQCFLCVLGAALVLMQ